MFYEAQTVSWLLRDDVVIAAVPCDVLWYTWKKVVSRWNQLHSSRFMTLIVALPSIIVPPVKMMKETNPALHCVNQRYVNSLFLFLSAQAKGLSGHDFAFSSCCCWEVIQSVMGWASLSQMMSLTTRSRWIEFVFAIRDATDAPCMCCAEIDNL